MHATTMLYVIAYNMG